MARTDLDIQTPLQRLIVERALVLAQEIESAAASAPQGQVIDRCESLLLDAGRESLRGTLEATIQSRVDALGRKAGPLAPAPAARVAATRGRRPGR